jgi:porin
MPVFKLFSKHYTACLAFLLTGCVSLAAYASANASPQSNDAQIAGPKTFLSFNENRSISSNPSAVNIFAGTAEAETKLEKLLGIHNNHGIRIGGMVLGDINDLFSGGIPDADRWTNNGLFLLDLSVDTEKFAGLKGGLFDVQFLQFNGQETNKQAGSVQGYNSLPGPQPINRSELYQLWYRQTLLDKKLIIRVGKSVPTFDFGNVLKPIPIIQNYPSIPAISGLLYTPIFVDASMLGVMPGYYNSAYGVTFNFVPIKWWYLSYGIYDGNLAQGKQTGLTGPNINGSYFNIGEIGFVWLLGEKKLPGNIGIGLWHQSGLVENSPILFEHGTEGYYIFGAQRLWYKDPSQDCSGILAFYQFGKNNSNVLPMTKYAGGGLAAFGLIPHRLDDSMGLGLSYAWLNQAIFPRRVEMMYQVYYQAQVVKSALYLEPALTYIPTPGASTQLSAVWAGTLRAILLF